MVTSKSYDILELIVFGLVRHFFTGKMAGKMNIFWLSLFLSIVGSQAVGEITILHSPESLKFSDQHSPVLESILKEVFSASLGLSVEENSEWGGVTVSDPFNTPEAVVEVYVDGISNLENVELKNRARYPLTVDEYEPDTFDAVKHRIRQRFTTGASKLVNIELSNQNELTAYPEVFGQINPQKVLKKTLQHLKYNVEEDYEFLHELEGLNAISAKVSSGVISPDNVVDFYYFRFRTLHTLSDFHGPNSLQTKEAKKLLAESLNTLNKAFVKAYDGSVLVTVVTTDVAHTRRTVRSVNAEKDDTLRTLRQTAEGENYDDDYPAIFNIILWFGVVFVFALIAIVYAIMDMDPGRDSIIYRMTSTRIKKDN